MNENNPRLKSAGRRLPVLLALCTLILTAVIFLPALAQDTPDAPAGDPSPASVGAAASDPDFNTIDDPLNGEYELFTVDDLLIMRSKAVNNNTTSEALNYILETENQSISSQSVMDADNPACSLTSDRQPQRTRIGRFFDLPYDVIVTLVPKGPYGSGGECTATTNMALHIQSTKDTSNTPTPFTMSAAQTAVAMDDFNQDGFEDLFIMSDSEMLVATAANLANKNDGMRFGPATSISPPLAARSDPATGDFNNDGLIDVAWIDNAYYVQFATVCPGAITGTVCEGRSALDIVLNPLQAGSTNIWAPSAPSNDCLFYDSSDVALAGGDYTGNGGAGLVTFSKVYLSQFNCAYYASWYEFNPDFTLDGGTLKGRIQLTDERNLKSINAYVESAALDWGFGGPEQAVIALGGIDGPENYTESVYVVSMTGGTMAQVSKTTDSNIWCGNNDFVCPWINGLAIGLFEDVSDSQSTDINLNPNIATLRNDGVVTIYSVNNPPSDFTPAIVSQTKLESGLGLEPRTTQTSGFTWLVAGDLQGRSVRLGSPSIVRVSSHSQPSV
ncbi:MAG: FG-GAP repeat domain-containing protein, partial [Candidatus Promineifilaceae bacterium]